MFRGGATAKCRSPKQTTTRHHRTLTGGFHVMISCPRSFHTTCKSCYNLFHGFVDRQRVTVWSSGCALEHFLRILHSTGVAVWVRVCFGLRLLWVCLGLGLVRFGFVLGWTWFDWACFGWDLVLCFRSRYKLISRACIMLFPKTSISGKSLSN